MNKLQRVTAIVQIIGVLLLLLLVLVVCILILLWPFLFAVGWSKYHSVQHHLWVRCLTVLLLFAIATQLRDIRKLFRTWYGAAEVVIGLTICFIALRDLAAPRMSVTVALAGGVYLMVRGIDNYVEGRNKQKETKEPKK